MAPLFTAMIQAGGRPWTNYDKHRIYFDPDLAYELAGGEVCRYKTGNISSATLPAYEDEHGTLSNRKARVSSCYWCLDTEQWVIVGADADVTEALRSALAAHFGTK